MKVSEALELNNESEKVDNIEDGDKNTVEELSQVVTAIFKLSLNSFLIVAVH